MQVVDLKSGRGDINVGIKALGQLGTLIRTNRNNVGL